MPSKIKAKPLRLPDETWAHIAKVSAAEGKKEHPTVVLLINEALAARGLGSPAFTRIAAGLKDALAHVSGDNSAARVHIPPSVPLGDSRPPMQKSKPADRTRWKK